MSRATCGVEARSRTPRASRSLVERTRMTLAPQTRGARDPPAVPRALQRGLHRRQRPPRPASPPTAGGSRSAARAPPVVDPRGQPACSRATALWRIAREIQRTRAPLPGIRHAPPRAAATIPAPPGRGPLGRSRPPRHARSRARDGEDPSPPPNHPPVYTPPPPNTPPPHPTPPPPIPPHSGTEELVRSCDGFLWNIAIRELRPCARGQKSN
jgi:hypothetical protein